MPRKPSKIKESRAVQEAVEFLKSKKCWKRTEMAARGIIFTYLDGSFHLTAIGRAAFDVLDDNVNGVKKDGK